MVIVNQYNENKYEEQKIQGNTVEMITTNTKGVGKNRNIALTYATEEILLFADDDMKYVDDYNIGIIKAFKELGNVDVIIFSCNFTKQVSIYKKIRNKVRRARMYNSLKYGICIIAVRRSSLLKANIYFSELFGGGTIYGCGEDSLFWVDYFRKGLKIYTHDFIIRNCAQDESTWFRGFDEKYFYDKGAWIECAFPKIKYFVIIYFVGRIKRNCKLNFLQKSRLLIRGIKSFESSIAYEENKLY